MIWGKADTKFLSSEIPWSTGYVFTELSEQMVFFSLLEIMWSISSSKHWWGGRSAIKKNNSKTFLWIWFENNFKTYLISILFMKNHYNVNASALLVLWILLISCIRREQVGLVPAYWCLFLALCLPHHSPVAKAPCPRISGKYLTTCPRNLKKSWFAVI